MEKCKVTTLKGDTHNSNLPMFGYVRVEAATLQDASGALANTIIQWRPLISLPTPQIAHIEGSTFTNGISPTEYQLASTNDNQMKWVNADCVLYLPKYDVVEVNFVSGDYGKNLSVNIRDFSNCTKLTRLFLNNVGNGNLKDLKNTPAIQQIWTQESNIKGDISDVKMSDCPNLARFQLSPYITGNIENAPDGMFKRMEMNTDIKDSQITGRLEHAFEKQASFATGTANGYIIPNELLTFHNKTKSELSVFALWTKTNGIGGISIYSDANRTVLLGTYDGSSWTYA